MEEFVRLLNGSINVTAPITMGHCAKQALNTTLRGDREGFSIHYQLHKS